LIKIIIASLFIFNIANADVRVYQYLVVNKVENNPEEKIITSTLNPTAYIAYHGGENVIKIDLLKTWMCYGHTAKKNLCNSPYGTVSKGLLP
jgi:hypothetical protein